MPLEIRDIPTFVQGQAATAQSINPNLTDLSDGSVLRAIFEANAGNAAWLQWLAFKVLQNTRLSTSVGADVDSWMAQFGLVRNPATNATGVVTFSRTTASGTALILPGTTMKTVDGSQVFTVTTNAVLSSWNPTLNGYVVPPGTLSVDLPVIASTPGTPGNVLANTITLLTTNIANISAINNQAAFNNGINAESDAAFSTRFLNFINTRSLTTEGAVENAIDDVQAGLTYNIRENEDPSGAWAPGFFTVWLDDGTGSPSSQLLSDVGNAVAVVKALTTQCNVRAATTVLVTVAVTLTPELGYNSAALSPLIVAAVQNYINTLGVGVPLNYLRISQVIQDSADGISAINSLTLNSSSSNISVGVSQTLHCDTVVVS